MDTIVREAYNRIAKAQKDAENFEREKERSQQRKIIEQFRESAIRINVLLSQNGRPPCAFVGIHEGNIGVFIKFEECSPIKVSLVAYSEGYSLSENERLEYIVMFSNGSGLDNLDEAIVKAYKIYKETIKRFQVEIP